MAQIDKPNLHFNTKLYTGNGGTQNITGVGFQPDWVWIKHRNGTSNHNLFDAVRGVTKYIESSSTAPNQTGADRLTAFGTDGFTTGSNGGTNGNNDTYVSWHWKAGTGQGSSNTDGSINTTYTSVNTTAGFSISQFVGTGSAATVGHGLGAVPKMYMVKNISTNSLQWRVYHASLGATKHMALDATQAVGTASSIFNDTEPTSSVFSVGTDNGSNKSGDNHIAYCFAEKKGYSKFGTWDSVDNANGNFVYTGFAPSFVMLKEYDGTNQWVMYDNKRPGYNQTSNALFANASSAEATDLGVDLVSNGYKIRATNNQSTGNYIFMAFAENPIVGSNNIPATAR